MTKQVNDKLFDELLPVSLLPWQEMVGQFLCYHEEEESLRIAIDTGVNEVILIQINLTKCVNLFDRISDLNYRDNIAILRTDISDNEFYIRKIIGE